MKKRKFLFVSIVLSALILGICPASAEEPFTPHLFASLEELQQAFTDGTESHELLKSEKEDFNEYYTNFLNKITAKDLLIPNLQLEDHDGLTHITFFQRDHYNLPWIFYQCKYEGTDRVVVRTTYFDILDIEYSDDEKFSEIVRKIDPDTPNVDNYTGSDYKQIYDTELILSDRTVQCLVYERSDYPQNYYHFVYDNMYVFMMVAAETATDEFWRQISFDPIDPIDPPVDDSSVNTTPDTDKFPVWEVAIGVAAVIAIIVTAVICTRRKSASKDKKALQENNK